MYIIYLTLTNNLYKEIKNERVIGFLGWNGQEWGKDGEDFRGKPFPIPPHGKPISIVIKENADEAGKHFRGIVPHQTPEK